MGRGAVDVQTGEQLVITRRLLTMRVKGAGVAVDVERVREVVRGKNLVSVPLSSAPVRGIMNLRGSVVTVLDFAVLAGFGEECSGDRVVLVRDGREEVGILVDEVRDVFEIASDELLLLDGDDTFSDSVGRCEGFYLDGTLHAVVDLDSILGRESP
jgi:chemotaxis signal transduction protein